MKDRPLSRNCVQSAILSTPVAVLGKKMRYYFPGESSIVKEPRKIIRTILR